MIKLGAHTEWTKSSYSQQNACVEVRSTRPASLDVTDSKFSSGAPVLSLSPEAFTALVGFAASSA